VVVAVDGGQERTPLKDLSNVLDCRGLGVKGPCTDCDRLLRHVPGSFRIPLRLSDFQRRPGLDSSNFLLETGDLFLEPLDLVLQWLKQSFDLSKRGYRFCSGSRFRHCRLQLTIVSQYVCASNDRSTLPLTAAAGGSPKAAAAFLLRYPLVHGRAIGVSQGVGDEWC
jgi:hypothetical protein